ncbi:MAG: hypothetical protein LBQ60_21280 [Bacteroidales bacterium]|jgi:phosphotransferase system  glucose/maltose/N-acetylglucosamine-specific IIC component|nr:hypothetical protein [Bacteroidales bacterium]
MVSSGEFLIKLFEYRVTIFVVFTIILLVIVGVMAQQRGRNTAGWIVLSFFVISPLIVMFILLCIDTTKEERIKRITEDEKIREEIRKSQN